MNTRNIFLSLLCLALFCASSCITAADEGPRLTNDIKKIVSGLKSLVKPVEYCVSDETKKEYFFNTVLLLLYKTRSIELPHEDGSSSFVDRKEPEDKIENACLLLSYVENFLKQIDSDDLSSYSQKMYEHFYSELKLPQLLQGLRTDIEANVPSVHDYFIRRKISEALLTSLNLFYPIFETGYGKK